MNAPQLAKSVVLSRTIWLNALATLIVVVTSVQDLEWVSNNPAIGMVFALVLSSANIILRFMTTQPITLTAPKRPA